MKNLVTLFLSLTVVLLLSGITFAQTVSLPDTSANPGDTLWIAISTTNLTSSQQIQAYTYTLNYDQTKLNIDAYDITGTITPATWATTYGFYPGEVIGGSYFMASPPAYLTGVGNLVLLRVAVLASATQGQTALHFATFTYNDFYPITDDGTITIVGELVAVQGNCFLQNQTSHEGTLVSFEPTVGGLFIETLTEENGYYSTQVVPGTYDVHFSHAGYQEVIYPNQVISAATTLPDTTLSALPSVNINGTALLSGQTNHSGIYAIFLALTPGAQSDTASTNSTGYYAITIFPGTYDVYFAKLGYDPEAMLGQVLTSNQTLQTVTLDPIPTSVTVSFPNIEVMWVPDTVLSVPVTITYISSFNFVNAYSLSFTYSPAVVQIYQAQPYTIEGTIMPDNWNLSYFTQMMGTVTGGGYTTDTLSVLWGQGPIVYFNFTISQNANATSPLNFTNFEFNGEYPPADVTVNGSITVQYNSVLEIPNAVLPTAFALKPNYPNPFNPSTTVEFDVPRTELVEISVYNIRGELVSVLHDGELSAGTYQVEFDATDLPSGLYFCRMTAGDFTSTKKMMLLE
jgi:hypothetical protein